MGGEAESNLYRRRNGPGDRVNKRDQHRDKKQIFLDMKKHVATKKGDADEKESILDVYT